MASVVSSTLSARHRLDPNHSLKTRPANPQMSPKQAIYREILRITLPHIRNRCSADWLSRVQDRGLAYDSELIHNIWPTLFEPDFQKHDLWFLNHHCRSYAEGEARTASLIYWQIMPLIKELFTLIPHELRSELEWQPSRSTSS